MPGKWSAALLWARSQAPAPSTTMSFEPLQTFGRYATLVAMRPIPRSSRSILLPAAALLGLAACDRPTEVSDDFFQQRERAVFSAFEQRAASEIEKLYDDNFVAINADGSITDKRQAVEAARTNALGIDQIKSDEFRVRRYRDTALVTGRSTYLRAGRELGQVRHTMTWVRTADDWKLVGWQGTPTAMPAGPTG